jgi:hypothetical protein
MPPLRILHCPHYLQIETMNEILLLIFCVESNTKLYGEIYEFWNDC